MAVPRHRARPWRAKTVVGVSPIIGDAPVHGMADACLAAIGVATTATAVAAHYGPGLLDGWLVDERDKAADDRARASRDRGAGDAALHDDLAATAQIAQAALELAKELSR